uniref:Peptidase n=1 Tax=Streptomyces phage Geonosis TaxID=3158856 RepID=A0AAU7GXB6_9CAUD
MKRHALTAAAAFVAAAAVVVGPVDQAAAPSPADSRVRLSVVAVPPAERKQPAAERRATVQATPAPERKAAPPRAPEATRKPQKPAPIRIGGYRDCTGNPQPCIDQGRGLTLYGRDVGVNILAAHNYHGYQWLSRVALGRTVVVASGPLAGRYRVTGHMRLNRQSGPIPSFGGADLVLQSCEGSGTGFSLLDRIN